MTIVQKPTRRIHDDKLQQRYISSLEKPRGSLLIPDLDLNISNVRLVITDSVSRLIKFNKFDFVFFAFVDEDRNGSWRRNVEIDAVGIKVGAKEKVVENGGGCDDGGRAIGSITILIKIDCLFFQQIVPGFFAIPMCSNERVGMDEDDSSYLRSRSYTLTRCIFLRKVWYPKTLYPKILS